LAVTGYAEVSDIAWRERELLDVLLFKLETQRLVVESGDLRWLARSTREIGLVLEQIRLAEITRAVELEALAALSGLTSDCTLADLAHAAPSPWAELFRAHRVAFMTLTADIHDAARACSEALDDACSASEQHLAALGAGDLTG
jgi:hypothetical protein